MDALAEAQSGGSEDPTLVEIYLAQHINNVSGGPVVAPWEIGQVPERYIEAAIGLSSLKERRQRLQRAKAYLDKVFSSWRRQHPSYRDRD